MRKREKIRDKKKAAKLDIILDRELVEQYIQACQCPFCKDGIAYKMLSLHISRMHGISAYEFRKDFGMNRNHKLISTESSNLRSEKSRINWAGKRLLEHPKWGDLTSRYTDGGKREEAIVAQKAYSNSEIAKKRFKSAMAKVDRRAVAATIPPEVRRARARFAGKVWTQKIPLERQRELMAHARSLMTPESRRIRIQHAQITMRKYREDPDWYLRWRRRTTEAIQARAKVSRAEYSRIVGLYENGISQHKIAIQYGVSRSLIYLIIKRYYGDKN